MVEEKILTISLRKTLVKKAKWKRSKIAILTIRRLLKKRLKSEKIKLSPKLNEIVWKRGIKKPITKIRVKVIRDGEIYKIEPIS
ncbi:MAG: 50S ribosomal protein L31e [Candidatus Aenigmatarchaeota archaeon]